MVICTAGSYIFLISGTSEILAYNKPIQGKDLINKTVNFLTVEVCFAIAAFISGILTN